MSAPSTAPHVIVHIGALDLASYGDQIYPLVSAAELSRRLDGVELLPFGPLGTVGDGVEDAGATWALGPWSPQRAEEIAARATLVLCGGGEIVQGSGTVYAPFYGIHEDDARRFAMDRWFLEVLGEAEGDCPVVWHSPGVPHDLDAGTGSRVREAIAGRALTAVRDEGSRRRLEAVGAGEGVEVTPDSAFLLPRVLTTGTLEASRDDLRRAGAFPPHEDGTRVLVVQGNHTMADLADQLGPALDALPAEVRVVTVSVSPCHEDGHFARSLHQRMSRPVWDVPPDSVETVAAAIAGGDCFLGVSLHGTITALAYERAAVVLDPFGQAKLAGLLDLVGRPERRCTDPTRAVAMAADLLAADPEGSRDAGTTGGTTAVADLQDRLDDWFDRIAALARERAATRVPAPVTWRDTGNARQADTAILSRDVRPLPATAVPGLRRPDVTPGPADLRGTLATVTRARQGRRDVDLATVQEAAALRAQNDDLRGAIAHLEGVTAHQEAQLDAMRRRSQPDRRTIRAVLASAVMTLPGTSTLLRRRDRQLMS